MTSSDIRSKPLCLIATLVAIASLAAVIASTSLLVPASLVSIDFPAGSAYVLDDSVRLDLQAALRRLPKVSDVASGTSSSGQAKVMVMFQSGTDPSVATSSVQTEIELLKNRIPQVASEGIVAHQAVATRPMMLKVVSSDPTHDENFLYNFCLINVLPDINRVPGIGETMLTGTARRYGIWLKVDRESLRSNEMTPDDIEKATAISSMIGSSLSNGDLFRIVESTPQSITFVHGNRRHWEAEQCENIVLRANAEGEILRLKDIGKTEMRSMWHTRDPESGERAWAAVLFTRRSLKSDVEFLGMVKRKFQEIEASTFPPGMTFEVSDQLPVSSKHVRRQ